MGYSDDDWCAWCGAWIDGAGRKHDDRTFCDDWCVNGYRRQGDSPVTRLADQGDSPPELA